MPSERNLEFAAMDQNSKALTRNNSPKQFRILPHSWFVELCKRFGEMCGNLYLAYLSALLTLLLATNFCALAVAPQTIASPQDLPSRYRTAFLDGVEEQNKGNLTEALRLYRQVYRRFPSFVAALFNMGLIYDQQGSTDKALDCFKAIADHDLKYPNLNLFIGIEETKRGNGRAALAPLNIATKENPQDKEGWFWLARAHLLLKNDVAAMNAATMARSLVINDPTTLFLIAKIYMDQEDWRGGEATLTEIIRDHPDLAGIHEALGTCYFMQDEFDLAMTQYSDEIAIDPTNGKANAMVGILFSQRGDSQSAIPYLESALKQNPHVVMLQLKLSRALWSVGNVEDAVAHAQLAEKLDQRNVDAHFILLRLYRELGRTADANRELVLFQDLTKK